MNSKARVKAGEGIVPAETPRLMLSGCPMAVPNWKLPYVIESSGAVVVGEESCIGTRNTRDLVVENGADLDGLIDALVDRYMQIDCACFTPNRERLDHIVEMARDLKVARRHPLWPLFLPAVHHGSLQGGKSPECRQASPCLPSKRTTAWRMWSSSKRASKPLWKWSVEALLRQDLYQAC